MPTRVDWARGEKSGTNEATVDLTGVPEGAWMVAVILIGSNVESAGHPAGWANPLAEETQLSGTRRMGIATRVKAGDTAVGWNTVASALKSLIVMWGEGAAPNVADWGVGLIGVRNAADAVPGQSVQAGDSTHSVAPGVDVATAGSLVLSILMEATGATGTFTVTDGATLWFDSPERVSYIEALTVGYTEPSVGTTVQVTATAVASQTNNGQGVQVILPPAEVPVDEGSFTGTITWAGSFTSDAPTLPGFPSVAAVLAQLGGATIAHRDLGSPACSLVGYQQAVALGHGILEFSCGWTSDLVPFGLGQQYLDTQSELPDGSNVDPKTMTWADLQANYQITLNDGGTPQPYLALEDALDAFPDRVFAVDPKYGVTDPGTYMPTLLDILDTHGGPSRFIVKFDSPNTTIGIAARARGYIGMNFWWDDTTAMASQEQYWDLIGARWSNAAALAQAGTYGKPVWAGIVSTQDAYADAILNGADLVMVSSSTVTAVPYAGGHAGEFTGETAWAGSFTGTTAHEGAFAGDVDWAGLFASSIAASGAFTGDVDWAGELVGARPPHGSFAGGLAWAGAFTGPATSAAVYLGSVPVSLALGSLPVTLG